MKSQCELRRLQALLIEYLEANTLLYGAQALTALSVISWILEDSAEDVPNLPEPYLESIKTAITSFSKAVDIE